MALPKIDIRPNSTSGTAIVFINGCQCGEMWTQDKKCVYKHTNRDLYLNSDCLDILSGIMKSVEIFGSNNE